MAITYDQVRREVKDLSVEISNTKEVVPGLFSNLKICLLPVAIYFAFYLSSYSLGYYMRNIWFAGALMSVFFWFFISLFLSGYSQVNSMIPKDASERYEIVKIYRLKAKIYYCIWISSIVIGGILSLSTMLNILALAGVSLVSSFLLGIVFNIDVSRYQISSALGVLSAVEEKINRRGN